MVIYTDNRIITDRVELADSFLTRLRGLLGKKSLAPGEGLLLRNCGSVHCFFMQFSIDVVYLSRDMTVLAVETLEPWRAGSLVKHAHHVLELPAGSVRLSAGDRLDVRKEKRPQQTEVDDTCRI